MREGKAAWKAPLEDALGKTKGIATVSLLARNRER
jgi:hypothetical protein